MAAAQARVSEPAAGPLGAAAGLVLSLASAVIFPFDRVLAGMVGAGLGIEALCTFLNLTRAALDDHLVRLGLATPHDRPLRRPGPQGWSIRDTIRLIAWRVAGVHPDIIGLRLDVPRSANAVRAKARRLGLPAPPRQALHKPDPGSLRDPPADFAFADGYAQTSLPPADRCGHVAGAISVSGGPVEPGLPPRQVGPPGTPKDTGSRDVRSARPARALSRPAGQHELPLFDVVGGTDARPPVAVVEPEPAVPSLPPVPCKVGDVDLHGDLTWFARVERPLMNPAAVWTCCMLVMGGLRWREAATRLGVAPAVFRSFRQRAGVPVDYDRTKAGVTFSETAARATLERSGYVLRQCMRTAKWFWVHKDDKSTRLSPCERKRDHQIEGRSNTITIITQAMLDAEARCFRAPFASERARVPA